MKNLKGKEVFVGLAGSILVILLVYYLLYLPKQKEISRLQKELNKSHKEVEDIEIMVSRVPNPRREIEIIQERLQKLKLKATDKEQTPRIMQQLFQKIAELNIEVISINPREDIKGTGGDLPEGVSKIYFEISIRSSYRNLVSYVEALYKLPLLFTIEDLAVAKTVSAGISDNLDVKMLLSAYIMA